MDFEHETLVASLRNAETRAAYIGSCTPHRLSLTAHMLGGLLVFLGNFFYGREPSYTKFKALEVIARIPYQSWEVASYTLLTALYTNEHRAVQLAETSRFSRIAQDNETMHVVVISQIVCRMRANNFVLHTLLPLLFALFYFWAIFFLYILSPRRALELNYYFEDHAAHQYERFLEREGDALRTRSVSSEFLRYYGRHARNEYELFESIWADEIVHRNKSLRRAQELLGL